MANYEKKHKISPEGKESVVNLRMQKILRYIEEHYAEDITLADLLKKRKYQQIRVFQMFQIKSEYYAL